MFSSEAGPSRYGAHTSHLPRARITILIGAHPWSSFSSHLPRMNSSSAFHTRKLSYCHLSADSFLPCEPLPRWQIRHGALRDSLISPESRLTTCLVNTSSSRWCPCPNRTSATYLYTCSVSVHLYLYAWCDSVSLHTLTQVSSHMF